MPLAYVRYLSSARVICNLKCSHFVLAVCHDLKAADCAQNHAGIIFSGLLLIVVRLHYLHENSGMETIHTGVASVNQLGPVEEMQNNTYNKTITHRVFGQLQQHSES